MDIQALPQVHELDELAQYMGQAAVMCRPMDQWQQRHYQRKNHPYTEIMDVIFVNYADERILSYTQLDQPSEMTRARAYTYTYYKDGLSHAWAPLNAGGEGFFRTFAPEFVENMIPTCSEFSFHYKDLIPTLESEETGEVKTHSNAFAFTEEVINYENFKWYRLHTHGGSLNKMADEQAVVESTNHNIKYSTRDGRGNFNYFFIRNERTKKWFRVERPSQLKRYKASREFMDALHIAHLFSD